MTPDPTTASDQRYAAFRHSAFLRFWAARFLATFSTQIVSVAVGWQVYDLTRDPFDLGLVGIVQFLPSLLLVLVTGAVVRPVRPPPDHGACRPVSRRCARWRCCCFTLARPDRRRPDLRRARRLRRRPRLLRAGRGLAGRQSRAQGGFRQRGRLELVGLADGDHRRAGRRRPALRAVGRDRPTASPPS